MNFFFFKKKKPVPSTFAFEVAMVFDKTNATRR